MSTLSVCFSLSVISLSFLVDSVLVVIVDHFLSFTVDSFLVVLVDHFLNFTVDSF